MCGKRQEQWAVLRLYGWPGPCPTCNFTCTYPISLIRGGLCGVSPQFKKQLLSMLVPGLENVEEYNIVFGSLTGGDLAWRKDT